MKDTITMTPLKRWLRPADLAEEFGISTQTQADMRSQGRIPYSKRGKFVYYDREKIDTWLEDAAMVS